MNGPEVAPRRAEAKPWAAEVAAIAERVAATAPRFTPDQLARIGAVLDAGSDSRVGAA